MAMKIAVDMLICQSERSFWVPTALKKKKKKGPKLLLYYK